MATGKSKTKAQLSEVSVNIPFGIGSAKWTPDNSERTAAWELYVELVTRVAIQHLSDEDGSLREALASLHSLFATTRDVLRRAGPGVGAKHPSVGWFAVRVLNRGLRPFLTKWHPKLAEWEDTRPAGVSSLAHERGWSEAASCRAELAALRSDLDRYAKALGAAAGIEVD